MLLELEDDKAWADGQVHAKFPKTSGGMSMPVDLVLSATLGYPPPNMSMVFEIMKGTLDDDGVSTGCYSSIHHNRSDITYISVEYPILDFSKVDPVQVLYEGPLTIISTYKVPEVNTTVYVDILENSLKSFDLSIWSVVILAFFVFSCLLVLRKRLDKRKEDSSSSLFETFSHMIGQESSHFEDRSGRVISMVITFFVFFVIIQYYLNLMSTDLIDVDIPPVLSDYRDIMKAKNLTVIFSTLTDDTNEFERAEKDSIQRKFWDVFKKNHHMADFTAPFGLLDSLVKMANHKAALMIYSQYSDVVTSRACKMKSIIKQQGKDIDKFYVWSSSDPKGIQKTVGLIMRQGIKNDLINKGLRRLRGVFEGGLYPKALSVSMDAVEIGRMFEGTVSVADMVKCASKTVNFNRPEVKTACIANFRYLVLFCVILLLVSFTVLVLENVLIMLKITRVRPL